MTSFGDVITPKDLVAELLKLSRALDSAHADLVEAGRQHAEAEALYRKTKATAFLRAAGKTVADREAQTDLQCGEERLQRDLARARENAAQELLRSIRTSISCLQSVANATKSEAEMAGRWAS